MIDPQLDPIYYPWIALGQREQRFSQKSLVDLYVSWFIHFGHVATLAARESVKANV